MCSPSCSGLLANATGGYTIRNVSRCWAYETAKLLDQEISDDVPWHEYMDYYSPDYKLHMPVSNMQNKNSRDSLEKQMQQTMQLLSQLEHAPNVQMQTGQPGTRRNPDAFGSDDSDYDEADADVRARGHKRCHLAEFYDTDGNQHDRMDTDKLGLKDFEEPPSDDDGGL